MCVCVCVKCHKENLRTDMIWGFPLYICMLRRNIFVISFWFNVLMLSRSPMMQ